MKFLFIVQGEGRGHLTQSIALKNILSKNGHEVIAILIGKSKRRELPAFFMEKIYIPIHRFVSPNFLPSSKHIKSNILISILYGLLKTPCYLKSILLIREKIITSKADIVVNFYEILTGLTYAFFPIKIPYISIAHQYFLLHPDYRFPSENKLKLKMLQFFTRLTCIKSSTLLALSFEKRDNMLKKRIVIVPPLLREEIFQGSSTKGSYLLGYLVNDNLSEKIIAYQKNHPNIYLHFFWDKKDAPKETVINDHLTFHTLDDTLFIKYMKGCKGYVTTAGFESVCEAMYFGKPALMVPTHIEQSCNAYEAAHAGAGIASEHFDIDALINFIPHYKENLHFRHWVSHSEEYWLKEINQLIYLSKKEI